MNAFQDPRSNPSNYRHLINNHVQQPPQPTTILLSDHQHILNEFATKCNRYQLMCVQYSQKVAQMELRYTKLQEKHESTQQELKSLQTHSLETEQKLKQVRKQYRKIVPEYLCYDNYSPNNRRPPRAPHKTKNIELMKTVLFQNEKYYYYYDDLMELFDKIQVYFNDSRKRYNYVDNAFKKKLFGDKNLNDLSVFNLTQLCETYQLSSDGDKHWIIKRLLEFSDVKEEKERNEIPQQFKQYEFWKYCDDLEESKKQRIIKLLSGGAPRGSEDKEDILLLTIKNDDNSTTEKVFRMDWTLNQWKIRTINKKQKRRHNGT
eukprot:362132_1